MTKPLFSPSRPPPAASGQPALTGTRPSKPPARLRSAAKTQTPGSAAPQAHTPIRSDRGTINGLTAAPLDLRRTCLLTLAAVAERLAVSTKTVRRWIAGELLHAHRLGRQVRVAEEDLQLFLALRRA